MGKIVEKKKKKGRPSRLDLQKRKQTRNVSNSNNSTTLNSSHNYKPATPPPPPSKTTPQLRRSTRHNPATPSDDDDEDDDVEEEEDEEEEGSSSVGKRRREKKLKLVLKLPSTNSKSEAEADTDSEEEEIDEKKKTTSFDNNKKRKINSISADGSVTVTQKGVSKTASGSNPTTNVEDVGPGTPLPDKKLLLFILDRLQKKDTYGVYSEPVDLEELPDYLEVIEQPMDFGTIRKKLSSSAYANLEQFEKDVFLICSNAMQYNAPDTIYFRQARSIQELAKKSFENLRQESDDNEPETAVPRRGRPPNKHLKKLLGRPSLEHAGSEYSLNATVTTCGESTVWSNNDLRKGPPILEKSGFVDSSGRSHSSRNDPYWMTDNKSERNDESSGSAIKGSSMRFGKRQRVVDENRRDTYKQLSAAGQEPSVLTTFDSERKQLVAVGLLTEHGYARSLARFAANVGTFAWKIASKRIERSLQPGIKYGPGWVGENDMPPQWTLVLTSNCPGLPSPTRPTSHPVNSAATPIFESKETQNPEKNMVDNGMPSIHSASEGNLNNAPPSSAASSVSPTSAGSSVPSTETAEVVQILSSHGGFNLLNSNTSIRPRPPFQIHQSHPGMNGFNGSFGFNLPAMTGKLTGTTRTPELSIPSPQMIDRISKSHRNFVHRTAVNSLTTHDSKRSDDSSTVKSTSAPPNSGIEDMEVPRSRHETRPSWPGSSTHPKSGSNLSQQQKSDLVPPDLNIRFHSPGSPTSSRVDSTQPDLALQL